MHGVVGLKPGPTPRVQATLYISSFTELLVSVYCLEGGVWKLLRDGSFSRTVHKAMEQVGE